MNKALLTLAAAVYSSVCLSQEIKSVSGKFSDGATGEYSYYEDEGGERVKHGYFYYERKGYNGVGSYGQNTLVQLSGNYKDGKPDSIWTEKYIEYRAGWTGATSHYDANQRKRILDGFVINNSTEVVEETIMKCGFSNGLPNGSYELKTYALKNGKSKKIKDVRATFKNGMLIGRYSYSSTEYQVTGNYDSLGFKQGMWTQVGSESTRNYAYVDSYIKSMSERRKNDGSLVKNYTNHKVKSIETILNKGYFPDTTGKDPSGYFFSLSIDPQMYEDDYMPIEIDALNKTKHLNIERVYKPQGANLFRKYSLLKTDSLVKNNILIGRWTSYIDSTTNIEVELKDFQENYYGYKLNGILHYNGKEFPFDQSVSLSDAERFKFNINVGDISGSAGEYEGDDGEIYQSKKIFLQFMDGYIVADLKVKRTEKSVILFKN